jgi:intracellular septation protein
MQLLFDFLPIIVFVVVYKLQGIYAGTAAIMVVMSLQVAYQLVRRRKPSNMLLASTVLVVAFGAATLVLRNPIFIQWKPTILNWLFAAVFLGSQFIGEKSMCERIMGEAIDLESAFWRQLNLLWVANFGLLGAANIYVVYNFDEATWVNFKLYGMLGITLVTAVGQAIWVSAHLAKREGKQEES